MQLPASWQPVLGAELEKPYFAKLRDFVAAERAAHTIYPPENQVFAALEATPYEQVSVFLLGQDPYHGPGQAHGLSFSVQPGTGTPPSLQNIFRELKNDLGCTVPNNGYLMPWAQQGVLLLNAVLTVREHQPNSHKGKGWEKFTDAVLKAVNDKEDRVVFVLWGGYARKKAPLIDTGRHVIVESAHPSPLSAHNGFFGSRPFSQINAALREAGKPEIVWQLPNL
jgi:uracil-DNA glycosylase